MAAEAIVTEALYTLPAADFSHLKQSIAAVYIRNLRRLTSVVSSPILFSLALLRLQSLSLHSKSLLIARHLLSNLTLLNHFTTTAPPPPYSTVSMKLRDLDAVLVLLFLCELQHYDRQSLDAPIVQWRMVISSFLSHSILKLSNFGGCSGNEAMNHFIENVGRCWNLVSGLGEDKYSTPQVAAAGEVVVALPSVNAIGRSECVICKDEMRQGIEVCELPCGHLFHWTCVLTWLRDRSTCPCCRRRLPTEDVLREIERLIQELAEIGVRGKKERVECS